MLTAAEAQERLLWALRLEQEFAEARMRWTCRVMRPSADKTEDGRGYRVPAPATVIYRGMFRTRSFMVHEQTSDVGFAAQNVKRLEARLPALERLETLVAAGVIECDLSAMPIREGDVLIRESGGVDVEYYRVAGEHDTTDATAQRPRVDKGGPELLEGGAFDV